MVKRKEHLEQIYRNYHRPELLRLDPLLTVRSLDRRDDRELFGLIAACLSYGRVERIIHTLEQIIILCENAPTDFIRNTTHADKCARLDSVVHRFNRGVDIALLMSSLKEILTKFGSCRNLYTHCRDGRSSQKETLIEFSRALRRAAPDPADRGRPFRYLLPSPETGSPCKRLNMYLRWMIRADDGIDLGLWKDCSPAHLVIPLDVHVIRTARRLRMTRRKSPSWAMAEEITAKLAACDPADPLRFDFALCHWGMLTHRRNT
ncbi:MAG: TIGR02757 family protein [Fibrobacterota bacterium]